MLFVSDFADQAVMLPLATVVAAGLGMMGWWRGVAAWALAVGGTLGTMLVLKAGFAALSLQYGSEYSISPSGHVASACVVYGGLAVLLFQRALPAALVAMVPLAAAAVVGYSRVALSAHSVGEVMAGAVVGLAGTVVLALALGPRPRLNAWPLATAGTCTVLALHGLHIQAEEAIRVVATAW